MTALDKFLPHSLCGSRRILEALWERLGKQYPLDYAMVQEIAKRFMRIRRDVSTSLALQEGERRDIIFRVSKLAGKQEADLTINEDGVLLLAAITDTIVNYIGKLLFSESFTKILEQKSTEAAKRYVEQVIPTIQEQSFKRCKKCNLDNDGNAKFCKNCANKLD